MIALFAAILGVFITCRKLTESRMAVRDDLKTRQVAMGKHADYTQKLAYDAFVAAQKARDDSIDAVNAAKARADSILDAEIMTEYQRHRSSLTDIQAREFFRNDAVYYEVRDSILTARGLKPPI
jgi:hypothetical protein